MTVAVPGMKVSKFKKILLSNMVMNKETILTQGYELLLNVFQLFGVTRCYGVPYS